MKKAFVSSIAILLSASMLGGTVQAANAVPVATSTTEETDYRYDEVYTGTCGNDTVSATYTFAFGDVREDGSLPLELTFSTEDVAPSEFTYYTGTYNTFWEDSDLISWKYDKSTRTLTFSGTGSMVDKENNYASRVWKHILSEDCIIQNVVFEEGITDLGYIDTTLFELSCWSNYDKVPMTNRTVSIPESVPEANLTASLLANCTYKVLYGSEAYRYFSYHSYKYVVTDIAKNPLWETSGSTIFANNKATWEYDYQSGVMTISGGIFNLMSTPVLGPRNAYVLNADVVVPDDPSSTELGYNAYMRDFLSRKAPIYCYKNSDFAEKYDLFIQQFQAYMETLSEEELEYLNTDCLNANIIFLDEETSFVGDANLDGKVDVTDAVLLNKVANGSVTLNDLQRKNMDCNGDGTISVEDGLALLRYLVHLEDSLPIA